MSSLSNAWSANHQSWNIGAAELHVVHGDIFDLPVESIVNPENTRFDMTRSVTGIISGQLSGRYAPAIQHELYRQTQNEALPVGTVLETSGFADYTRIYHIGHEVRP